MTLVEIIAALLGIACVALGARRSIWNYAFGIASVALLGAVFLRAKLYSDALLQVFFVAANLYGWINWRRNRAEAGVVIVELMTWRERAVWAAGGLTAILLWGWLMHRFTDASYPWTDAGVAIVSVIAQVLMAQRKLENWALWIAIDCVAIPLYALKAIWVTAGLYVIYLALAIWGHVDWSRARRDAGPGVL